MAASCLPFVAAAPDDFVDDIIRFNLGSTALRYPTSGFGLPAQFPGTVRGPMLLVVTVALVTLAGGVVWWAIRRRPDPVIGLACGSLALGLVLLTVRTFQQPYITLIVTLAAPAWLALGRRDVAWAGQRESTA
jgi:hypothetical protein